MAVDLERIVAWYVAQRAAKKAMEERHKLELAPLVAAMEKAELFFLTKLNQDGTESVKTKAGTFFKTTKTSATVASRETFLSWVRSNDQWDLADIRAAKVNIAKYKEEHKDIPPGINWHEEITVNIRKAAANGNKGQGETAHGGSSGEDD